MATCSPSEAEPRESSEKIRQNATNGRRLCLVDRFAIEGRSQRFCQIAARGRRSIAPDIHPAIVDAAVIQEHTALVNDGRFGRDRHLREADQSVLGIAQRGNRVLELVKMVADGRKRLVRVRIHKPEAHSLRGEDRRHTLNLRYVAVRDRAVGCDEHEDGGPHAGGGRKGIDEAAVEIQDAEGLGGHRATDHHDREHDTSRHGAGTRDHLIAGGRP